MLSLRVINNGRTIQIECDDAGVSKLMDVLTKLRDRAAVAAIAIFLATPAIGEPSGPFNRLDQIGNYQLRGQPERHQTKRERARAARARAHDRQACIKEGYGGPDLERCISDAVAQRRGMRPGQETRPGASCYFINFGRVLSTLCE